MKERFYTRGVKVGRAAFVISLLVVALLLALLVYLLIINSTAPWWTYLFFPLIYVVAIVYALNRADYYVIDEERKILLSGNMLTGKEKEIYPLNSLIEVLYLPYTKEVKLLSNRGAAYLKLREGKAFVDKMEQVFEAIMT